MARNRIIAGIAAGALIASLAALSPATGAASQDGAVRARGPLAVGGIGSFTPAATDARLAAALARTGMSSTGFRFTPASSVRLNRSVTVAVRAQSSARLATNERVALVAPSGSAIVPVAYNLGLAVGWRKFAVSSDVARVDIAGLGRRESVDLGISYAATKRLSGRVQVGADRANGPLPVELTGREGYSVDVGGSYSLTRNLDVTAGVRYRADRDRLVPQADARRDSQAVYVGTAFRF